MQLGKRDIAYIIVFFLLYGVVNEIMPLLGVWSKAGEWYNLSMIIYRLITYLFNAVLAYVFLYKGKWRFWKVILLLHMDVIILSIGGLLDRFIALVMLVGWSLVRYGYLAFWIPFFFTRRILRADSGIEFFINYGIFLYCVAVCITALIHFMSKFLVRMLFLGDNNKLEINKGK